MKKEYDILLVIVIITQWFSIRCTDDIQEISAIPGGNFDHQNLGKDGIASTQCAEAKDAAEHRIIYVAWPPQEESPGTMSGSGQC